MVLFQGLETAVRLGYKRAVGLPQEQLNMVNVMRGLVLAFWIGAQLFAAAREVTFISTSDSHYRQTDHKLGHHNDLNRASIEEMNRVTSLDWPEKLGGGKIAKPRGVVALGDLIDDGDVRLNGRKISAEQYQLFRADFGLDGTDGVLKFPTFEGWGNHDGPPEGKEKSGFSSQGEIRKRNLVRREKGLISNVAANGLHYSWDWDDVHFVQLNLYPADKQHEGLHYSPVWHDPQGSLAFLKQDLAAKVGKSGRPVVLMSHCGFDTDWWVPADWKDVYDAARDYNIVLYLYGHSGTGIRKWAPEGETQKWDCLNDGQTDKGFFVIQLTDGRLRAAMRVKTGVKVTKQPDGTMHHEWSGGWEWKWFMDKKISPPVKAAR
ncbi:MAG: metallophosphoesterase [Kiritimatiellaeota bacterium]|nr:metallophosphoesterase [Kiritimatiellota bacterium]